MEVGGQRHAPAALPPGKIPGTHCTRSWVGPRANMDSTESFAHTRIGSPGRRPVGSLSTQCAIPVHPSEILVNEVALGQVLLSLYFGFAVSIFISPMPHTHLRLNTILITRTRGQSLGTFEVLPDIGQ